MRHLVLAQARAHRGRYVATALAVIVAVAFVVLTLVLSDTVNASITKATAAQYEGISSVVTPEGPATDPDRTLSAVGAAPGVRAATLDVTGPVRLADGASGYGTAATIASDESMRWQRLADGRWPAGDGEIAVGSSSGRAVGDTVTVADLSGEMAPASVTVVGVVDVAGSPLAMDSGQIFGSAAQVRAWSGGSADWEIRVAGDGDAVRDAVALAAPGTEVVSGEARATAVSDAHVGDIALLRNVLLCFAAIAVVVAGLVIANTFAVLLAARTRELALMRCVGVTASQVRRSVRGEALIVGFVSAVLGVLAGCGLAAGVVAGARAADAPIPLTSVSVTITTIVAGLVLGTVVTVVAANGAARTATRVSALAALHPLEAQPESVGESWVRRACALLAMAGGSALLVIGAWVSNVLIACPGGLLLFVGVVLASRRIVPAAVGAVGDAFARAGGPVAALAAGNARRNPRRTASTATALFIGVTLTATIVVGIGTLKAGAPEVVDENFPVDIAVTATAEPVAMGGSARLTAIDGVHAGTEIASATVTVAGTEFSVLGVDPVSTASTIRTDVRLPESGTIVLERSLAETLGVQDGEIVEVGGGTGMQNLAVAIADAGSPDMISMGDLSAVDDSAAPETMWLKLDDDLSEEDLVAVTDEVSRVAAAAFPGSEVVGAAKMRQTLENVLDTMLLIVAGLLSVAVVIALIGVGNTMALSVLERRRETAMLRSVGLSRSGVRSLLVREAVIIAGVASILGVALGLVLGTFGTASVIGASHVGLGAVPWLQLAGIVVAGGAAGIVASLVPAQRASRVSPVAALAG
ncbi:putative ABC transport system permease protein [Rhodococcus sp. SMB37]|uniref:FtsX-like permease family protein n=1 Tax=Rhodococcus sp. SMB37 TaxID=2512213 RepID=UPI00104BDAED|nr:ABC transporter permease [Rhodococcus sp. SMB37]TCN57145.1 putative ABC transport system permease protein [Rhodococcus sp. SMB37]